MDDVSKGSLLSLFPLTWPIPSPVTNKNLIQPSELQREEDLLRNATSFRHWWTAIHASKDILQQQEKQTATTKNEETILLGPLASPISRLALQKLTYMYESALYHFPTSFKLWKSYLLMRCSYVMGKAIKPKRAGGRKKLAEMREALEDELEDAETWEGGLDGVVGWEEWKALIGTFERSLMWLPTMPRLWLLYFNIFQHPECPAQISHTHARRTFDRALRTLPPSMHHRVWSRYLLWSESKGGITTMKVYRRYLNVDPSLTERYTAILLASSNTHKRPLEAAKLLLGLARKAAKGQYLSPEGKSPYQLLGEWIEVVESFPEEIGLDVEETEKDLAENPIAEPSEQSNQATNGNKTIAPQTQVSGQDPYDEDTDPISPRKLNIERIIKADGLQVYKDQAGRLWTGLATYWLKRGEFSRAKATFEEGIASVLTVRDFTQIFDSYAESQEAYISALMGVLEDEDEDAAATEQELDVAMKSFEELMDRRPFLVNEVLLRRNPHDVQEWEKRIALWGTNDEKVAETYTKALETVTPRRATANLHRLYVNFAKFYEGGGTTGEAEHDLESARKIFEKGTKVNFRTVDELAELYCEWSEMELIHENYDEAIRIMQRAAFIPKNPKISYHDQSLPVQARLFKSLKLWSFYVDLEESIGTVETTKAVYDKIIELKIANAQVIVNYAAFLEDNKYYEESFKIYERGVELFNYPISFEIWNIYLAKFIKRYGGSKLERTRDLFEQALEKCPAKFCKSLFLMYAKLEEDYGLAKRAMSIFERACEVVQDEDKYEMYLVYIAKATENYGMPATRPIYERALQVLPDRQSAKLCLRFAAMERKLGEIDRARAIYAHASQFCDPRVHPEFWKEWNAFEVETGSEDTFKEYLRIRRSVQSLYNTEISYLAAAKANVGDGKDVAPTTAAPVDPMAAAEQAAKGPSFVKSKLQPQQAIPEEEEQKASVPVQANAEEIQMSDDE